MIDALSPHPRPSPRTRGEGRRMTAAPYDLPGIDPLFSTGDAITPHLM
jgi:hypothetical protein